MKFAQGRKTMMMCLCRQRLRNRSSEPGPLQMIAAKKQVRPVHKLPLGKLVWRRSCGSWTRRARLLWVLGLARALCLRSVGDGSRRTSQMTAGASRVYGSWVLEGSAGIGQWGVVNFVRSTPGREREMRRRRRARMSVTG